MADPGFPLGRGTNPQGGDMTILLKFPENCMKLKKKKIWSPRGGACPLHSPPLDPPLVGDGRWSTNIQIHNTLNL